MNPDQKLMMKTGKRPFWYALDFVSQVIDQFIVDFARLSLGRSGKEGNRRTVNVRKKKLKNEDKLLFIPGEIIVLT